MNKFMISVDWLQVYCSLSASKALPLNVELHKGEFTFVIKPMDIQTAMFKDVYCVYSRGLPVAVIQSKPRSSRLDKCMALVKLDNRVLYSAKFIRILYAIIEVCGMVYKGITRIDLCHDCIKFKDNRSPSKFINSFVSGRGVTTHNIRKRGSEEFTCHGKKPSGGSAKINYIRFGSPKSKISSYIYDKSLELKESKDKPWIRAAWDACGLFESDGNIFRSEISIKAEGADVLNMGTGELFRLSPDMLESQDKINHLFYIYAKKYFDFRLDAGQKHKKNFKKLWLFELVIDTEIKPVQLNMSADTGRIEKICYNVLERLSSTYTDLSEYHRRAIMDTQVFLLELSGTKTSVAIGKQYNSYLNSLKSTMFRDVHFNDWLRELEQSYATEQVLYSHNNTHCEAESMPISEPYYPNEVSLISEADYYEYCRT